MSDCILKKLHGSMYAMHDTTAYFIWAVSYACKIIMKLATGANVIYFFKTEIYEWAKIR